MQTIFAEEVLTAEGWRRNVRVRFADGRIAALEADSAADPGDDRVAILLPTVANLHSHAFQRAMAGLAETRGPTTDTFWTWREVMYRFALTMGPDDVEAVAAMLYVEMLEAGFGRVGEFHYLHHQPDGSPYADVAELAGRIVAAASDTGIALTLLPVFYAHSTFGGEAPTPGQRRFINDVEGFARLADSCRERVESLPQGRFGIAPHSLRATTPEELAHLLRTFTESRVHMHVAEQVKEVEDCLAWSDARPVEWLLANAPVDPRWCLIHATHMTEHEARAMAATGAVAGLCPLTEANLGDGIFQGPVFSQAGGRFGVGSDSNVQIGLAAELRQFEYAQRLGNRQRNVMVHGPSSTGRALFDAALQGGAAALDAPSAGIAVGQQADLFSLDRSHPTLDDKTGDAILDAFVFADSGTPQHVWIGGRKLVENGSHVGRERIELRYRAALRRLTAQ